MICKKERFNKTKYCNKDFTYQVSLIQKNNVQPAHYGEKDAFDTNIKTITLWCYLKITRNDFAIGGEYVGGETSVNIICNNFNDFDNIRRNTASWDIQFRNEKFHLEYIRLIDELPQYVNIYGKKSV